MSLDLCTGCGVGTGAVFVYTVTESDHDADGIGIAPDALILEDEASITDLAGNDAEVDLSGHVFDSHPDHKVDGSVNHRPIARRLQIHSKPNTEDTYRVGEIILLNIEFDEHVIVSGFPKLELQIGDHARLAELDEGWSREGPLVFFDYEVQASDYDADGISIAADALHIPEGSSIADRTGTQVESRLAAYAVSNDPEHKVDGRGGGGAEQPIVDAVRVVSSPQRGDTYTAGNRIQVEVLFGAKVTLEWSGGDAPQLELAIQIGDHARPAPLNNCVGTRRGGARCEGPVDGFLFTYDVTSADRDPDGLSIMANALQLNGTRVRDLADNDVELILGAHAIANDAAHKVDGGLDHHPMITSMYISSRPQHDDTYGLHEEILVAMNLDENVDVTGEPTLAIEIGDETRDAAAAADLFRKTSIYFRYFVEATDVDSNGISIGASALHFDDGSIHDAAGNDIPTDLASFAIENDPAHRVDGTVERLAMIEDLLIFSLPRQGDTYGPGETIDIRMKFSDLVVITWPAADIPPFELTLGIGSARRTVAGGTTFQYEVLSADHDPDGISIAEDALRVVEGTVIRDGRDREITDVSLKGHAITNHPRHKVDGARSEPVPLIPPAGVIALALLLLHLGRTRLRTARCDRARGV